MPCKMLSISLPEYTIDHRPDYMALGRKVDPLIEAHFGDGKYVVRAIGKGDHPDKSLDELVSTILELGTDKYDPCRHEVVCDFRGYDHDFQAGPLEIRDGRIVPDPEVDHPSFFGDIVYHFYEHTPYDRGYAVRIDLLTLYDHEKVTHAVKVDPACPGVLPKYEAFLYKFKNPERRREALLGIVKILRATREYGCAAW